MRLGRNEKVDLIRGVPLFTHCSRAELAEVTKIADEIDVPEGKELMREGDRGREFFVLLDGTAVVRRGGRKVNTLGAGDFFGEVAILSEAQRTATLRAASAATLLTMDRDQFSAVVGESLGAPEFERIIRARLGGGE